MNLMGLQGGQYCPLSSEQIETVHEASLKILEKTGITYEQGLEDTVQMPSCSHFSRLFLSVTPLPL